jgi:hypothetical protein
MTSVKHVDQKLDRMIDILLQIRTQGVKNMAALDDAVATLQANFTTLDSAIQAEIAALQAALAANNQTGVNQAIANISQVSSKMADDAKALTDSTAAPPPTAPTT